MKKLLGIIILGLLWCNVGVAQKIIIIPVHVHILDLSEVGKNITITESEIRNDFKEVNRIWSQANIFFEIKTINNIKANVKDYDKDRKWVSKYYVKYITKGTKKEKLKASDKMIAHMTKLSRSENFKLHTDKLNVYYLEEILPVIKDGGLSFEMTGYNIRPNSEFMDNTKWDKRYFTGVVKNTFRSGITFVQITSFMNGSYNRAHRLAHELGHQFLLSHQGKKLGKDVMAWKCDYYEDTKMNLCGDKLSSSEISKSRDYYNRYYKQSLN